MSVSLATRNWNPFHTVSGLIDWKGIQHCTHAVLAICSVKQQNCYHFDEIIQPFLPSLDLNKNEASWNKYGINQLPKFSNFICNWSLCNSLSAAHVISNQSRVNIPGTPCMQCKYITARKSRFWSCIAWNKNTQIAHVKAIIYRDLLCWSCSNFGTVPKNVCFTWLSIFIVLHPTGIEHHKTYWTPLVCLKISLEWCFWMWFRVIVPEKLNFINIWKIRWIFTWIAEALWIWGDFSINRAIQITSLPKRGV